MKKMIALTTGAAVTVALGAAAAKPLAILGLGSLVMTVWAMTFHDTYASDILAD